MSDIFTKTNHIYLWDNLAEAIEIIQASILDNISIAGFFREHTGDTYGFQALIDMLDTRHQKLSEMGLLDKVRDEISFNCMGKEEWSTFPIRMWDALFDTLTPETLIITDNRELEYVLRSKKPFRLQLDVRNWLGQRNASETDKFFHNMQAINQSHASSLAMEMRADIHALSLLTVVLDGFPRNSKLSSLTIGVDFVESLMESNIDSNGVIKKFWKSFEHFIASASMPCFRLYFFGPKMSNNESMISCCDLVQGMANESFQRALRNNYRLEEFDVLYEKTLRFIFRNEFGDAKSVGSNASLQPTWKKIQECVGRTLESELLELESKLKRESLDKVIYEAARDFSDAAILEFVPKFVEDAKFVEAEMKAVKRQATKAVLEKCLRRKVLYGDSMEAMLQALIKSTWCPFKVASDRTPVKESPQKDMVTDFASADLLQSHFKSSGVDCGGLVVERSTQTQDEACSFPDTNSNASDGSESGLLGVEELETLMVERPSQADDDTPESEHSTHTEDVVFDTTDGSESSLSMPKEGDAYPSPATICYIFDVSESCLPVAKDIGIDCPQDSITKEYNNISRDLRPESCIFESAYESFLGDADDEPSDCSFPVVAIDCPITKCSEDPTGVHRPDHSIPLEASPMSTAVSTESSPLFFDTVKSEIDPLFAPESSPFLDEEAIEEKPCFPCLIM